MGEELAEDFRDRDFVYLPIRVSAGIILHIGAGIYTSLAGALKELVSNAFDADATRVVISTGYPRVQQIEVIDNGKGMSPMDLAKAMVYIGTSLKRTVQEEVETDLGRPIIGMLGIGLMSLTQVCDRAIIESKVAGEPRKFRAELDFRQFRNRIEQQREDAKLEILAEPGGPGLSEIEAQIRTIVAQDAARVRSRKEGSEDTGREFLGYFLLYPNLPADPSDHGTRIVLHDLDEAAIGLLLDADRHEELLPPAARTEGLSWTKHGLRLANTSWRELCGSLQAGDLPYHALPRYQQFLWELSAMTPVPYFDDGPVIGRHSILAATRENLRQYKFSLVVDNTQLSKPALLPTGDVAGLAEPDPELDYYVESFCQTESVGGDTLEYEGYMLWQREQVQPSALRGLQIYIRNVGIGVYDKTILDWSVINPGPRAAQISGEIYVRQGLERALNIDRNSFRQTDPHFVALQNYVYDVLGRKGRGIVGKSVDSYWARRSVREDARTREHRRQVAKLAKELSFGRLEAKFVDRDKDMPYEVVGGRLIVYDKNRRWPRAIKERHHSQRMLVALESAIASGAGADQLREMLKDLLLRPER